MLYFLAQASTADSLLTGEAMGSGPSLSPNRFRFGLVVVCVGDRFYISKPKRIAAYP